MLNKIVKIVTIMSIILNKLSFTTTTFTVMCCSYQNSSFGLKNLIYKLIPFWSDHIAKVTFLCTFIDSISPVKYCFIHVTKCILAKTSLFHIISIKYHRNQA